MTSSISLQRDFFFAETAAPKIYTLSLHDALPISGRTGRARQERAANCETLVRSDDQPARSVRDGDLDLGDRKSTRLNSSHVEITYAVFCVKTKEVSSPTLNTIGRIIGIITTRSTV